MEKRYQVFVSSTYIDLTEERAAVIQAILGLDHLPAGMEMFPAADDDQWTLIKRVIDNSDYYVVVVGGRYGSLSESGISFTEKEYDYAVERGIPVLGFVHGAPEKIESGKVDQKEAAKKKLAEFRAKVETRMVKRFSSAAELGGHVAISLTQAVSLNPGVGWVRGDKAMTLEQEREILGLREQIATLAEEKRAAESALVEDTSGLAQGSQPITVRLFAKTKPNAPYGTKSGFKFADVTTTWDAIFGEVAPVLVDEGSADDFNERLKDHLMWTAASDSQREKLLSVQSRSLLVNYDERDRIVTQFRALGLIDKGEKKRPVTDSTKYLRLTNKGDRHLTTLVAVKAGVDPGIYEDSPIEGSQPSEPTAEPEPPQDA